MCVVFQAIQRERNIIKRDVVKSIRTEHGPKEEIALLLLEIGLHIYTVFMIIYLSSFDMKKYNMSVWNAYWRI